MFILLLFFCRSEVLILGIWVRIWLISQVQTLQIYSRNNVLDHFLVLRSQWGWFKLQHVWTQLARTHPISPSLAGLEECYRSNFKIKQQRFCSERWKNKRPRCLWVVDVFPSSRMLTTLKCVRNMPVEEKRLSQLKQISSRETGRLVAAPHYWPSTCCLCLCLPPGQVILLGWFEQSTNNLWNLCLHSKGGE